MADSFSWAEQTMQGYAFRGPQPDGLSVELQPAPANLDLHQVEAVTTDKSQDTRRLMT